MVGLGWKCGVYSLWVDGFVDVFCLIFECVSVGVFKLFSLFVFNVFCGGRLFNRDDDRI